MTVKWEYEKREAMIGNCKAVISMNHDGDGWDWIVTSTGGTRATRISGTEKLASRAEELVINAANWLNAGCPATER